MINSLVGFFLGCTHSKTTFPITPMRSSRISVAERPGTYVACLDCGKEFSYNWQEMRVEKARTVEVLETASLKVA
jgi:hypothetical protein